HGLEPLQAEGQPGGQLLAGRLLVAARLARQQEPRFEEGEPGRHHQVVGGQLETQLARLGDELEVLVGELQDGNLGEVHLLRARERQQHVERSFEAVKAHHQGAIVRDGILGRLPGFEAGRWLGRLARGRVSVGHVNLGFLQWKTCESVNTTLIQAASCRTSARQASASASSKGCCCLKTARACSKRASALPSSGGATAATASVSSRPPLQASTTSEPSASTAAARSATLPRSAFMARSSLIRRPSNPIAPRITSLVTRGEVLAGASPSIAVKTTWAVMAAGRYARRRNGRKSVAERSSRSAVTTGRSKWLSAVARPWPGTCFMTGKTPPAMKPSATAAPRLAT